MSRNYVPLISNGVEIQTNKTYIASTGSTLHRELTERCFAWLHNRITRRGLRAEFEIMIDEFYVADAAALFRLQSRYQLEIERKFPEIMDNPQDAYSAIFETKVSVSDYNNMFHPDGRNGSRFAPYANYHYLVLPKLIYEAIKSDFEYLDFWGILIASGKGLKEIKSPKFIPNPKMKCEEFANRILWKPNRYNKQLQIRFCPDCNKELAWK